MNEVGLRERKKIATRRAIAAVALELALRDGPDRVTVDDIAEAADVSARTVFNYFGTKDEAILGLSPEARSETVEMVRSRPLDEAPLQSLKAVLYERITTVDETGDYWRARAELVRKFPELHPAHVASQSALEADLTSVIAEQTGLDPDVDMYPRLVVATAFAALRVSFTGPATGRDAGETLGVNLDAAFDLVAAGLCRPSKVDASDTATGSSSVDDPTVGGTRDTQHTKKHTNHKKLVNR